MHGLGAGLEDGVKLGALFEHFPGSFEAGRHYESGSWPEFPTLPLPIFEHDPTFREAAELRLGVTYAPLAGRARPSAGVELLRDVGEVIGDGHARIARKQAVSGRGGVLVRKRGREVDNPGRG